MEKRGGARFAMTVSNGARTVTFVTVRRSRKGIYVVIHLPMDEGGYIHHSYHADGRRFVRLPMARDEHDERPRGPALDEMRAPIQLLSTNLYVSSEVVDRMLLSNYRPTDGPAAIALHSDGISGAVRLEVWLLGPGSRIPAHDRLTELALHVARDQHPWIAVVVYGLRHASSAPA